MVFMWNFANQTEGVATHTRFTQHSDQDISEMHLHHLSGSFHIKKHFEQSSESLRKKIICSSYNIRDNKG